MIQIMSQSIQENQQILDVAMITLSPYEILKETMK